MTAAPPSPPTAAKPGRPRTTSPPRSSITSPPTISSSTTSTARSRTTPPSPSPAAATTAPSPSALGDGAVVTQRDWFDVGGGESGFVVPDPRNPNIVYAGSYDGLITRFDKSTGQTQEISAWPL